MVSWPVVMGLHAHLTIKCDTQVMDNIRWCNFTFIDVDVRIYILTACCQVPMPPTACMRPPSHQFTLPWHNVSCGHGMCWGHGVLINSFSDVVINWAAMCPPPPRKTDAFFISTYYQSFWGSWSPYTKVKGIPHDIIGNQHWDQESFREMNHVFEYIKWHFVSISGHLTVRLETNTIEHESKEELFIISATFSKKALCVEIKW